MSFIFSKLRFSFHSFHIDLSQYGTERDSDKFWKLLTEPVVTVIISVFFFVSFENQDKWIRFDIVLYIPSAHQSTALLCPFDWMISGAAITNNNVDIFSLINFCFFRNQRQNTFVICKGKKCIFWTRSEYEKKCFFLLNLTQASKSFVTWIIRFYNDIATTTKQMEKQTNKLT